MSRQKGHDDDLYMWPADVNMIKDVDQIRTAVALPDDSGRLMSCINTYSSPSGLKITDMRVASISGCPMPCSIIRLDTNQGITGYGEVRDHASFLYALMLKRHLLGENPCNVEKLFRRIRQFGGQARQGGGVSAVEIALWDLAGKAYGVPVYQMLGGKYRDKIRCYCDTHTSGANTGVNMGKALKERMAMGFTFLKMNLNLNLLAQTPGTICAPLGLLEEFIFTMRKMEEATKCGDAAALRFWRNKNYDINNIAHPFTGIHYTEKGLDMLEQYVAEVREVIGFDVPLAMDNFGHIPLEDCIRVAKRMEKYNPAWLEDLLPWQMTGNYARLAHSTVAPIATGEDIYLHNNFEPLLKVGGIAVAHTDLLSVGGILENKKVGDLAQQHGVALAIHMAESPVACMAAVHSAAATENFLALEFHSSDVSWWDDIIESGNPHPLIEKGFITVPDKPGLGIDSLNDEILRKHVNPLYPEIWQSTEQWDTWYSRDRQWS